jgi:ABC-type glucose/galactose transport system permease subunit
MSAPFQITFLFSMIVAFLILYGVMEATIKPHGGYIAQFLWCVGWFINGLIQREWWSVTIQGMFAVLWAWLIWKRGPWNKLKKILKAIGAKTKAKIKKMSDFVKAGTKLPKLRPTPYPGAA